MCAGSAHSSGHTGKLHTRGAEAARCQGCCYEWYVLTRNTWEPVLEFDAPEVDDARSARPGRVGLPPFLSDPIDRRSHRRETPPPGCIHSREWRLKSTTTTTTTRWPRLQAHSSGTACTRSQSAEHHQIHAVCRRSYSTPASPVRQVKSVR